MAVGLALEGDGEVGAQQAAAAKGVPGLEEAEQPFEGVEEKERQEEQLALLTCVDAFVAEVCRGEGAASADKDEAADVEGREAAEGQKAIDDDQERRRAAMIVLSGA